MSSNFHCYSWIDSFLKYNVLTRKKKGLKSNAIIGQIFITHLDKKKIESRKSL